MLRAASLAHLRVDIEPDAPGWRERLARAALDARALEAGLELAIFVPSDPRSLDEVASALCEEQVPIARVLAFSRDEPVATAQTVALVRERLGAAVGSAAIVGGTNVFFTDINRFRPDLTQVDGIAWPITATVHASDDASVAEMPPMHGETVRSARAFCSDRTLHVTPVTFNMRFNPHATGPLPAVAPGELPPQVDRRQPSLLGAGWTMASLRHLAESGVSSVTYYETTGWRGLIESEAGPAAPERFASWPGMVFPLYHVLADAGAWQGGEVIAIEATHPLAVEALAVRGDDGLHVLVASLTPAPERCRIEGLPPGPPPCARSTSGHSRARARTPRASGPARSASPSRAPWNSIWRPTRSCDSTYRHKHARAARRFGDELDGLLAHSMLVGHNIACARNLDSRRCECPRIDPLQGADDRRAR